MYKDQGRDSGRKMGEAFTRKVRIIAEPSLMSVEPLDEATSEGRERPIPGH